MATAFSKDFLSAIYEFVPCAQVYTDELRTLAWGTDGSFYRMTPQMVIRAENEQQVSHIVQVLRTMSRSGFMHLIRIIPFLLLPSRHPMKSLLAFPLFLIRQ